MYKNSTKGSYSTVPVEAAIANEKQKEVKPLMWNVTTQTEELMNAPLLGVSAVVAAVAAPESKPSSLPERRRSLPSELSKSSRRHDDDQDHLPTLTCSSSSPARRPPAGLAPVGRGRLVGVSATPEMTGDRRQSNVAVIDAVVESDPEESQSQSQSQQQQQQQQHSKRSSPSQSSKTESAHGHPDLGADSVRPGGVDEADRGRAGDDELSSLELDQRSDYDNQPASDLEVNLESEADLRGLDASGDDLGAVPDLADSSDSESDDSGSSIGEEQALFQQLQSNPRVRALQENAGLGDRDPSAANLSWDAFQHQPSFTVVDPGRYAFQHPYALDNDILSNRYYPESGSRLPSSQGKSLDDYDHELPYDPDPDATVV